MNLANGKIRFDPGARAEFQEEVLLQVEPEASVEINLMQFILEGTGTVSFKLWIQYEIEMIVLVDTTMTTGDMIEIDTTYFLSKMNKIVVLVGADRRINYVINGVLTV